jgi:transcriptional regulator with GAF, ATPase, and Fis domain
VQRKATWIRASHCDESIEAEIRQALITCGVEVEMTMTAPYGVVCFERVNEDLLALLHESRRDSRRRILAVAVSPQPIETGAVWRLIHAGADDVLIWRSDGAASAQLIAKLQRWFEVDELATEVVSRQSLVGNSPVWQVLIRNLVEAARFSTVPVLLTGESGTGKELLARLVSTVHASMPGRDHPRKELVTVDCASLVPDLSGSEFFGHERGAFTDAHVQREGAFALADGATLFLDEIGEVPLGLQPQLLRAVQEKTYKRVGGNVWYKTNCRLVCATNRNLEDCVQRGEFRLDLYYRIAGFVFHTPALRDRKEDILPLAKYFLSEALSREAPEFDSTVKEYLLNRVYRGNVRELRQLVERIAHRHVGSGPITAGDIPEEDRPLDVELQRTWPDEKLENSISNAIAVGMKLKEITQAAAETAIRIAIREEGNNLQRAAKKLGVTDRTLQMRRAAGRLREPA